MASKIQVYKLAATAVGASVSITDPSDDRPVPRAISAVWDIERRAAIRDGSWNFATTRALLPALAQVPSHGFAYAYQEPPDFLRLIEVSDLARDRYQREGKQILTNTGGPLAIRYLRDVPEPADWDDDFAQTFALRLAWRIGRKIAGSTFDVAAAWRAYTDALADAKTVDAIENPAIEQEECDWVLARYAGAHVNMLRPFADDEI